MKTRFRTGIVYLALLACVSCNSAFTEVQSREAVSKVMSTVKPRDLLIVTLKNTNQVRIFYLSNDTEYIVGSKAERHANKVIDTNVIISIPKANISTLNNLSNEIPGF